MTRYPLIRSALALGTALLLGSAGGQAAQNPELAFVDLKGRTTVLGPLSGDVGALQLSPDGRQLLLAVGQPAQWQSIALTALDPKRPQPLSGTPLAQAVEGTRQEAVAPNGRWQAIVRAEPEHSGIWLEPLPTTGARYRLTPDGSQHPLWSADGKYLYFDRDGRLFRLEVFLGAELPKAGEPKALPIAGFLQDTGAQRQFTLMPDGKRLLMLFPGKGGG